MTGGAPPPGHLRVLTTLLAMDGPPEGRELPPPPRPGVVLLQVRPTLRHYRHLYDAVGEPWLWYGRRAMPQAELEAWLASPDMELWVPHVHGVPAGMAELDRRDPDACRLAYLGLVPEFVGRGLGPWLLDHAVHRAFAGGARRLTVSTCSLDHPAALGTYLKAGFRVTERIDAFEADPRLAGWLPRSAGLHVPLAEGELAPDVVNPAGVNPAGVSPGTADPG